ncbi:MAG TPA: DUF2225 domain-containing protein [bacterium]|nr:DUF2225 domain-containing protein [bacterium]
MTQKDARQLLIVALTAASLVLIGQAALATSVERVTATCPVCGREIEAQTIVSTNNLGGQDTDFLTRAGGQNPIMIIAITCPQCLYSGYLGDFREPVSEEFKAKFAAAKLRPLDSIDKPWVRHDLIAQVMKLKDAPARMLADQYLKVSWAARLADNPFEILYQRLSKEEDEWVSGHYKELENFARDKNPAEREVDDARAVLAGVKEAPAELRYAMVLYSLRKLSDHGEHELVAEALPMLQPQLDADDWSLLAARVNASAEIERRAQRKAVANYTQGLQGDDLDEETRIVHTYLCGELQRRLGRYEQARALFQLAQKNESKPEWLDGLIARQLTLFPAGQ